MADTSLFCEAADPEANTTSRAYLPPVFVTRVCVAEPPQHTGVIGFSETLICSGTKGYLLTGTVPRTFLTDLTVLDDAFGGHGTWGQGQIGEDLRYPDHGALIPRYQSAMAADVTESHLDGDRYADSGVVSTGNRVVA